MPVFIQEKRREGKTSLNLYSTKLGIPEGKYFLKKTRGKREGGKLKIIVGKRCRLNPISWVKLIETTKGKMGDINGVSENNQYPPSILIKIRRP